MAWKELRYSKLSLNRTSRRTGTSNEEYLRQLSGEED